MAITEIITSRTQHITREGETITQVFRGPYSQINALTDGTTTLPIIGTPWSRSKPNLCVTDILITPLDENASYAEFVATYSTGGQRWPENLPDTVASVKQEWDFQVTPGISDEYYDYGTSQTESWSEIWAAFSSQPTPPRVREDSTIVMNVTGLLSTWNWRDIRDTIGKVNNATWLQTYCDRYVVDAQSLTTNVESIGLDQNHDDTGQWLFAGFRAENVGRDTSAVNWRPTYRVTETFLWERDKWNNIYGVTGYQAYATAPFNRIPRPTEHSINTNRIIRT